MSHAGNSSRLYDTPSQKQSFKFTNIITDDTYGDIELYPDDTNLTILNKLCVKLNILTDEICAYVNDYKLIGFSYDNIDIKQIFNKNKIDLTDCIDGNFVDKIGNMMNVNKNNLMNKLFEGNFNSWPTEDNNIYYFTLNDLLGQKPEMDNQFLYSVVYKYFPNIGKDYIDNYKNKYNSDLRKDYIIKIKKLLAGNNYFLGILDNYGTKILNEQGFTSTLLNFKCINIENNINIIKLFSDYELSSERFYTKLILEDYNNSFFKLYKPALKLPHSDASRIISKPLCNKLLNDFSDNVSLPYDFKYMPPSIQPRNCMIFKTYLKKYSLFYSFILFMNGSYDFIINNYKNKNIDDDILKELNKDINTLINDINRVGVYTINKIPILKQGEYNGKISFMKATIEFSMINFEDVSGDAIYDEQKLLKYLENFTTHIRIVKEKKDLDPDTIRLKYKRVNNYETIDTIQSIISALHNPDLDVPHEEFIEIISQNTGISIKEATIEHEKWFAINNFEFKKKTLKTSEAGAEIIMSKYLDRYIKFSIYNVLSRNELNRIIQFIKIFMKLYAEFIEGKLPKKLKKLFTEDIDKGIDDIQEEQQLYPVNNTPPPLYKHNSQVTNDQEEDLVDISMSDSYSSSDSLSDPSLDTDQSAGGVRKIQFLKNLQKADDKLFINNYARVCTNNSGIKMPIPLEDDELEKLKKYDVLKTVRIKGKKLTYKEIRDYILDNDTVVNLKKELDEKGITYSIEFPSFLNTISQHKIDDNTVNINYICPKYWDIPKRVSIHPRDIYDRLDDIIPRTDYAGTDKSIICNEGGFILASDSEIKKTQVEFLRYFEVYNFLIERHVIDPKNIERLEKGLRDSMRIIKEDKESSGFKNELVWIKKETPDRKTMDNPKVQKFISDIFSKNYDDVSDLDMKPFNDYIIKKIPEEYYDLLHQQIVKYIQPRFLPKANADGFLWPCCHVYKPGYEVGKPKPPPKLNKVNIRIGDLTPSNINKFAHIHPELQNLFGFEKEFYDNDSHLGGFIKFGVEQEENSLINVLSNLYNKNNDNIDFKKDILEKSLTDENSLLTFMKCGDGNIVQLFKSSKYNINDIEYFVDYIADEKNTMNQLKKININNKDYKKIKNDFEEYGIRLMKKKGKSGFDKYGYINEFNDKIYNSDINIKFIYDLIISKNNFIEYLNSNEIKDYKYILPLMSEIKNDHIYILFENNDDSINIRLPLNTYDIYNDKCIFNFIYKVGDIYEPIYYFNDIIKRMENGNMECDIKYDMHSDGKINEYIGNILDSISGEIKEIYRNKDDKYFSLETLIKVIKQSDDEPDKLLIDPYCKVSHVITKNNCIFPIIPSGIIDGYELIYSFDNKPSFKKYLEYRKKKVVLKKDKPGVEIYMDKLKVKGFIIDDKNNIINIVFKNNTYIPIKPEKYDKTNKFMKRSPILGYKDLFIIDKDLQNFAKENDNRVSYNTNNDYRNYITNLAIQNIIYFLKRETTEKEYNTETQDWQLNKTSPPYTFKLIPKFIGDKKVDIVEENTDFIDYFYDENKFIGTITKTAYYKVKGGKVSKLTIKKPLLNELYLILNNGIHTNFDKQTNIFDFLYEPLSGPGTPCIIDEIIIKLPDDEYEKHKLNNDSAICFENNDDCQYPCSTSGKCKLYVKESDIYDEGKSLINKIIYKFIDLLLIHKNIDKISSILQDTINLNDLYKTAKNDEVFFNYIQYQNKYIDELFKSESKFIRDINFYDRENTYLNQSHESKPIKSIIKGVPNIIKKIFPYSNVLTYIDDNNLDFQALEYSFSEINKGEISSEKLKSDIYGILNQHKSPDNTKLIRTHYSKYDNDFRNASHLTNIEDIIENIKKKQYKINPFDLELLTLSYAALKPEPVKIGFLLISSKYSNEKNLSKLKHNILLKYKHEENAKDTKFILLYHFLNEDGEYDLSNIVFKTNDGEDQYKSYLSLDELLKIPDIKTIIENDYSDLI